MFIGEILKNIWHEVFADKWSLKQEMPSNPKFVHPLTPSDLVFMGDQWLDKMRKTSASFISCQRCL